MFELAELQIASHSSSEVKNMKGDNFQNYGVKVNISICGVVHTYLLMTQLVTLFEKRMLKYFLFLSFRKLQI